MLRALLFSLLLIGVAGATHAQLAPPSNTPSTPQKKAEPNEANLQTHDHYRNKAGQMYIHRQRASTARCRPEPALNAVMAAIALAKIGAGLAQDMAVSQAGCNCRNCCELHLKH
jgi:hypothetical protein